MEFLTILLSSLLGLVSPAGLLIDRIAEQTLRSEFEQVEQLQVRVDNTPSYQIAQGEVNRVRIAGRGLRLKQQDIRIAALELETDPIELSSPSLAQRQLKLERPLQAGVRLVLTQPDLNQALQSLAIAARLSELDLGLDIEEFTNTDQEAEQRYKLVAPQVKLLPNNRLRFQVELQEQGNMKPLAIAVESGLSVVAGRRLQLVQPVISIDQEAVTDEFVSAIANNINQKLDLGDLEKYGLQARILQLRVDPQKLEVAAFVRLQPSSQFLNR